jgi:hypothetical protein
VGEETWASPTRLALVLAGGGSGGGSGSSVPADAAAGTIIVETNYRVGQPQQQCRSLTFLDGVDIL